MHSATIPLAALATFAAVYWLAPAPAGVAPPEPVAVVETASVGPAPVATRAPDRVARSRPARKRRAIAARSATPVRPAPAAAVYFPGCNAVRAAGLAPLLRGQPGYRPEMDGDDDGIACEPYRGRR